jgi:anti-anti-sigma regulatory factor
MTTTNTAPTAAAASETAPTRVTCGETLDLAYSSELRAILLTALASATRIDVDASAVTHADTANLQVLAAAAGEAGRRGGALRVIAPSGPFLRTARHLGLSAALGLTSTGPQEN